MFLSPRPIFSRSNDQLSLGLYDQISPGPPDQVSSGPVTTCLQKIIDLSPWNIDKHYLMKLKSGKYFKGMPIKTTFCASMDRGKLLHYKYFVSVS
jgi:hypothetical protein